MTNGGIVALGVDWYRQGWVGVVLRARGEAALVGDRDLAALIARVPDADVVGVDMPIGLPEVERQADRLARAFVGRRRSSVFMTPPHAVLQAADYAAANAIAPGVIGKKISQQAWALRDNIAVVERIADRDARVIEVHPEVSFRAMAGEELVHSKHTLDGQALRRDLLRREGIVPPAAGRVPVVDVLDAAAATWSARRYALGEARAFPSGARRGERGVIWY